MPLPIVVGVVAAVMALIAATKDDLGDIALESVKDAAKAEAKKLVKQFLREHREELIAAVLSNLLGVQVDGEPTELSITEAVNGKLGTSFSNLFSADLLREDLLRMAIERIQTALPMVDSLNDEHNVRYAVRAAVFDEIKSVMDGSGTQLLPSEAAEIIKAAAANLIDVYDWARPQRPEDKPALLMDDKSVKNRERQARYRASHTRVWVEK
jgi:hypothetical protein